MGVEAGPNVNVNEEIVDMDWEEIPGWAETQ